MKLAIAVSIPKIVAVTPAESNQQINVLHLLGHLAVGGVQRTVVSLLPYYNRARYRLSLATVKNIQKWEAWAVHPEVAASRYVHVKDARDNAGIAALARLLQKEKIDILHCHAHFASSVGRQAAILAGTPVVIVHFHSTYAHRRDSIMAAWEKVLWPFTSRGLMVSESTLRAWEELTGLPEDRCTVVWGPLDIHRIRGAMSAECPQLDQTLQGVDRDLPVIASIGRLVPLKRVTDTIEAIRLLKNRGTDVRLVVAGDGPDRENLEEQARSSGLSDRIHFLGEVPEVAPILAKSKAFVLSSIVEGLALCNLEAMACGTPVITTHAGGAPLEVDPGNRFLKVVRPRDPMGIADAIADLIEQRDETERRIALASEAVARFDAGRWYRRIEEIYEEELSRNYLKSHLKWGYGGIFAPGRLGLSRAQWRRLRRRTVAEPEGDYRLD